MIELKNKFRSIEEIELQEKQEKNEVKRIQVVGGKKGFRFDKRLHKYLLDGLELLSVTQLIDKYKTKFESNYISNMVANKNKRENKEHLNSSLLVSRYWDVLGERASSLGTSGHAFCEAYWLNGFDIKPLHIIEENAKKLLDNINKKYIIVNMEQSRGNKLYGLGYTIDIELQDRVSGEYVLGDFKFSSAFTPEQYKISKGRNANLLHDPFKEYDLRDVPKDKGEVQLNIYKELFQTDTGQDISYCILFHIDGLGSQNFYGDKGYYPYIVRDLKKPVMSILESQKSYAVDIMKIA